MYEEYTYDYLMKQLIAKVPTDVSTEEGSVIYTALSPLAFELEKSYIEMDVILKQTFGDTADYDYLEKRALERGITPIEATYCKTKGVFNVDVPVGTRFFINDMVYVSGEPVDGEEHTYVMTCQTIGTKPNGVLGTLTPIDYVDGLESAELTEIMIAGRDRENVESFRARYLESFDKQSFGGNVTDYITSIMGIEGVGGVHIYPVWNGGGTVKAEIIGSDYLEASEALIKKVQNVMCPAGGMGYGICPIGHTLTVVSAIGSDVSVKTTITYSGGYSKDDVQEQVKEAVAKYFDSLRKSWQEEFEKNKTGVTVRIAEIESRILAIQGIIDVTGTTLNGKGENVVLDTSHIPKLKEVVF